MRTSSRRSRVSRSGGKRSHATSAHWDIGIATLLVLVLGLVIVSKGNGASATSPTNTNSLHRGSPEVHTVIDLHNPQLHPRQLVYDPKREGIWFWNSLLKGDEGCENQVYFYDIHQKKFALLAHLFRRLVIATLVWHCGGSERRRVDWLELQSCPISTRYRKLDAVCLIAQPRYPLPAAVIGDLPTDLGIADLAVARNGTIWIARYAALSLTTFNPATQIFPGVSIAIYGGRSLEAGHWPGWACLLYDESLGCPSRACSGNDGRIYAAVAEHSCVSARRAGIDDHSQRGSVYLRDRLRAAVRESSLARMPAITRAAALQQQAVPPFEQATVSLPIADRSLAADVHGRIWMAVGGEPKIAVFDPETGKLQQYSYPVPSTIQYMSVPYGIGAPSASPADAIPITPIAAMVTDNQGHLWLIRDLSDQIKEVAA